MFLSRLLLGNGSTNEAKRMIPRGDFFGSLRHHRQFSSTQASMYHENGFALLPQLDAGLWRCRWSTSFEVATVAAVCPISGLDCDLTRCPRLEWIGHDSRYTRLIRSAGKAGLDASEIGPCTLSELPLADDGNLGLVGLMTPGTPRNLFANWHVRIAARAQKRLV